MTENGGVFLLKDENMVRFQTASPCKDLMEY